MKSLWWKILTVILLLYALLLGTLTPLKPGISNVSPFLLNSGQKVTIQASHYNSDLGVSDVKAYLKKDSVSFLEANSVRTEDGKYLLDFDLPSSVEEDSLLQAVTLLITDKENGTLVYPEGFQLKKSKTLGSTQWNTSTIPKLYKKEGFLFPYRNLLMETIRNIYYHVSLWFAMFILFFAGMICSILYLVTKNLDYDHKASSLIYSGILFGILGLITGSLWAKVTWGAYWTNDMKLNMSAISMLIYLAYWILRSGTEDVERKATISSAYNIFAFVTIIPLIFVLPRIADSLHPGNGGNPALGGEDLDNTMRMVFYPAVIGFTLLGVWLGQILLRIKRIKEKIFFNRIDM